MKQIVKLLALYILLAVFLLTGCEKQPAEETKANTSQSATQGTNTKTEATGATESGQTTLPSRFDADELPPIPAD